MKRLLLLYGGRVQRSRRAGAYVAGGGKRVARVQHARQQAQREGTRSGLRMREGREAAQRP